MKLHARDLDNFAIYASCFADGSVRLYREQDSYDGEEQSSFKIIQEELLLGGNVKMSKR